MKRFFQEMKWYFLQLFPLVYTSHYWLDDGDEWVLTWKMRFGRVFNFKDFRVEPNLHGAPELTEEDKAELDKRCTGEWLRKLLDGELECRMS